ncbi:MAG: pentapeptide repeat-containing protein [Nostoc sp. CmiVER01]|uniref:pentapeptide repeat-containing protein n=1 Tax=Nostoc sp. CmiVER01 TaxID=3075384 RepID=UPI002AD57B27|nr:pentapeptide repeat-containing protein [Nostoc sp. CmiVER01]MDZ8121818.1 pentapeptide repeat-containing protein [Nostoc sp. CmiVER01]
MDQVTGSFRHCRGAVGCYVLAQKETNKDRLDFEADKEQKRLDFEHRKDIDTAYQAIIQELTTPERPLLRAAAAMKLGSLLQEFPSEWSVPEYRKNQLINLTKQILAVALINETETKVRKVLTTSLAQDSKLQELDLSEVQAANAYWAKIDFTGTDFFKADLCCTSFRKANLCRVQFRSANLQEAVLAEANCTETNFKLADLSGANLRNANMIRAILVDANLEQTDLQDAYNLSVDQIKAAKNWEHAHYDQELRVQLGLDS